MGSDSQWAIFDEEGATRQRCLDIDDRTDDLRDAIERSSWSWAEFQEMYDITWIFHENGLEGVVLTYPEIKSAVDNKIISDVSLLPTYEHIKDQKWCIDEIRRRAESKRSQVTVNLLKDMHVRLLGDESMRGVFRKDIPIHRTYFHQIAQPEDIEAGLEEVVAYLNGKRDKDMHPIEFAAYAHHKFMAVFPFSKFSGMLGRLVLNFILGRYGYLPAVIHATDRQAYYEALRGPERDFRQMLLGAMENSLDNALRFFGQQNAQQHGSAPMRARA